MNSFFKDVIAHLLKNAFEGHTKFSVADNTAVGANPIRSISLDAVPVNNDTLISLSWEGGEKLFEKTLSEQEASHQFDLISTDLAEVSALTKQGEYDAAKDLMKKLGQKYAENTGDIVETNLPKLHNTQASVEKTAYDEKWLEKIDCEDCRAVSSGHGRKHYCEKHQPKEASQDEKIWRTAKITMQNLWFSTTDELLEYQKKQKGATGGDQDHIPLWDAQKGKDTAPKDELAPASMSYEDLEKSKERDHEDMQKHIDEKIKTELESALQEKAASVFGPDQVELVKVLKKNGRNWDEIKKILVKDFNFEKDSVNIFIDEQRESMDPTGIDVEPVKEEPAGKPGEEKPLTPPEDLVSPETHDKLLQDHEDKKKDKDLNFAPKDVMDIPEDDEIEEQSSAVNEIARADNDDIHKVAADTHEHTCPKCDDVWKCHKGQACNEGKKALCGKHYSEKEFGKKKAAPSDLNPLQEPIQENLTTPTPVKDQDTVPMDKPLDHNAPQKGDRVFVSSDLADEKAGFEAVFISTYKSQGMDFSIVETDAGDLLDIESHRVTKTSEGSGAQDTEPVMEPQITQQQQDDALPVTPKMDDFHTSSQDPLFQIKAELASLENIVKAAELDIKASETFTTPVDVDDIYMQKLLGHTEITSMKQTNIQWQLDFDMREWGVKSANVYVPDQTITLVYEFWKDESAPGAADDTYEHESKQVQITNVQVEGQDRTGFDQLAPNTLTLESDGKWVLDFGTSQHYSSQHRNKIYLKAGEMPAEHICEQCKKPMGYQGFLGPVCSKCVRKNHKKVTQGSDFEKGISQNKTSDETLPAKNEKKNPSLKDKDIDPYKHHSDLEWEEGDPCKLCKSPIDENCQCTNESCEFRHCGQSYAATKPEGSEPDQVDLIMSYEQGDLDDDGILKLFSMLIKSGQAWSLQGSYGRTAKALIEGGYISDSGVILKDVVDTEIVPDDQKLLSKQFAFKNEKTAAEPEVAPKTQFKDYKITPKYTPKEQAIPATPEMDQVLTQIDNIQQNLATLEAARKQIQAKMKEEMDKIDQQGGRAEMEAALQEGVEKAAILIEAVDSKVVQWKDKLFTMQTEQIDEVPSITPKQMLEKIYAKFEGAEKYVQDVLNGMLSQAKRVVEKTLIRWPNKKSSVDIEASLLDEINRMNEELLAALKLLSSPL